jgi:hypothetical protein
MKIKNPEKLYFFRVLYKVALRNDLCANNTKSTHKVNRRQFSVLSIKNWSRLFGGKILGDACEERETTALELQVTWGLKTYQRFVKSCLCGLNRTLRAAFLYEQVQPTLGEVCLKTGET